MLATSHLRSYLLNAAIVQGADGRVSGVELPATAIGGVAPNGGVNRARASVATQYLQGWATEWQEGHSFRERGLEQRFRGGGGGGGRKKNFFATQGARRRNPISDF